MDLREILNDELPEGVSFDDPITIAVLRQWIKAASQVHKQLDDEIMFLTKKVKELQYVVEDLANGEQIIDTSELYKDIMKEVKTEE